MPLLQRYILAELLRVFLFLVSVGTVLMVFVGVFREVTESGLGPGQALQILPFVVPSLLPFTIPAMLLLTVCVVYGRMAGDLEITAAKAAGINVLSLMWPSFGLAAVLSLSSFYLMDQSIPWAMGNIQRIVTSAMEDIFLDVLRTQHQVSVRERGVSITVLGVEDRTLQMPTFQYAPRGKDPITVQAQSATIDFDLKSHQVNLHLVRGYIDIPGQRRAWFAEIDKSFPLPKEIQQPKPRHMSIEHIKENQKTLAVESQTLQEQQDIETALTLALGEFDHFAEPEFVRYRKQIGESEKNLHKLHTEIYSRLAMSLSCFCFVLVGAPYAILRGKKEFLKTFFWVFMPILMVYYPVVLLCMNLSKTGDVDPTWAMWIGNLVMVIAGLSMLRRVMRY